ncbi:MAG: class III lanthionine synthetase LanKC [Candidatus Eremiobacteraeota bacterium]|nr:class III lanthionine synthetase LanKC [Candidatus Eremiobacteraeota bacterium]
MPTRPGVWDLISGREFFEPLSRYQANENDFIGYIKGTLGADWGYHRNDVWFHCVHPTASLAAQGWKIHVSATTSTALETLRRVLPVFVDVGVNFKCAADKRLLSALNGKNSFRGGSGKFITVYPHDAEQFKELMRRLHAVTHDLRGPYILSDRRYADSGVLFYRYGGIVSRPVRGADGVARQMIVDPDGNPVYDKRTPQYVQPSWAVDPFEGEHAVAPSDDGQESRTLKNGRYYIEGVLAYSNSGGVYVATDRHENRRVVIKEARPLVSRVSETDDAISILKKEARLLALVGDLGISPQLYDTFQDWEHFYIVEEYVEAVTLWTLSVQTMVLLNTRPTDADYTAAYDLFRWVFTQVCDALTAVHAKGIVLADVSPHNVLVDVPRRRVWLIDHEGAYEPGVDAPANLATPGFVSPQRDGVVMAVPTREDDYYSLAALMVSFVFRITHFLQFERAATARIVRRVFADARMPADVTRLVEAALVEAPAARPTPEAFAAVLRTTPAIAEPATAVQADADLGALTRRAAAYIHAHATPRDDVRLFPCDFRIYSSNPVGLFYGSAGILNALAYVGEKVPDVYVDWTLAHAQPNAELPPGLALGRSGIAWALLNVGRTDDARALLAAAEHHPLKSDAVELFHGLAGYGLTELAFFLALHDERHLANARAAADQILARGETDENGNRYWVNNGILYGLTWGAAGIALFLLYLGLATGDEAYVEQGRRALRYDVAQGVPSEYGGMEWPYTSVDRGIVSPYWSFGSAGIGTVALRYRYLAGMTELDPVIDRIRVATDRAYTMSPNKLLGLSGLGGFNLDAYGFTGDEHYLAGARTNFNGILMYAIEREEGLTFPGSEQNKISCDYAVGSAGVMMYLHRLATAAPPEFMLDRYFSDTGTAERRELVVA